MSVDHKTFYYFLVGALFFHAAFLAVKFRDRLDVTYVPSGPIKINFATKAVKEIATASFQKRQIVQSDDSASSEKPLNKAFLSDKDRKFDRETMAKAIDSFNKAARGNAAVTNPKQSKEEKTQKKAFKDLKLADFGMQGDDAPQIEKSRSPASESLAGLENGDLTSRGLSATNDYVEEVALGDFTHLNTVEYKHYGFFHRIRQKLEQFWGKTLHEKANNIFRSGRRLPASDNLITSVQVTLNPKGEIISVKIMGTSGVRELDDAAVESFNQAGPFPNPPKDLLVDGKATIEWGFVVKS